MIATTFKLTSDAFEHIEYPKGNNTAGAVSNSAVTGKGLLDTTDQWIQHGDIY